VAPLRILLADDHTLMLAGIRRLLENRYEVVGGAENGRALVDAALTLKPDLVVLDISMPLLNGIDAAREIKSKLHATKIVFLTMHGNAIYLRRAINIGALGYVLKSEAAEELLTAIEEARRGKLYVTSAFSRDVLANSVDWLNKAKRDPIQLTDRQREILQMVAEGKQNKEIADIAHISVKTVEFHRSRLMTKLDAHSVVELTKFAIEEGLVTVPVRDPV
jgi:DNA-binding NarL/FixJ family response regulator